MITTIGQIAIVLAAGGATTQPSGFDLEKWLPTILPFVGVFIGSLISYLGVLTAQQFAAKAERRRLRRVLPGKLLAESIPCYTLMQQAREYTIDYSFYATAINWEANGDLQWGLVLPNSKAHSDEHKREVVEGWKMRRQPTEDNMMSLNRMVAESLGRVCSTLGEILVEFAARPDVVAAVEDAVGSIRDELGSDRNERIGIPAVRSYFQKGGGNQEGVREWLDNKKQAEVDLIVKNIMEPIGKVQTVLLNKTGDKAK